MTTITFRPATRENVNLLIGLAGGTGSGKTFTGMRLAAGMSGGKKFAVIDTENGRASHYADQFSFDVAELREPFSPGAYTDAIIAADAAGYPVIMVDSMSHEYSGSGGVLDMQEAEFARMGSRDAVKVASWIKPKGEHKKMVTRLLQVKAHLILCFRAEPKIEVAKDKDGKTVIVPKKSLVGLDGWIPVSEKNLPYELTVSFLFTADKPGFAKPIKLQEQHRALFPLDKPITEESGRAVAAWAAGGDKPAPMGKVVTDAVQQAHREHEESRPGDFPTTIMADYITPDQVANLETACQDAGITIAALRETAQVARLSLMAAEDYPAAMGWIERRKGGTKKRTPTAPDGGPPPFDTRAS